MAELTYRQKYDRKNPRMTLTLKRSEVKFIDGQLTTYQTRADWLQKLVRKEMHRLKAALVDKSA